MSSLNVQILLKVGTGDVGIGKSRRQLRRAELKVTDEVKFVAVSSGSLDNQEPLQEQFLEKEAYAVNTSEAAAMENDENRAGSLGIPLQEYLHFQNGGRQVHCHLPKVVR
jgi:hypothetical protein